MRICCSETGLLQNQALLTSSKITINGTPPGIPFLFTMSSSNFNDEGHLSLATWCLFAVIIIAFVVFCLPSDPIEESGDEQAGFEPYPGDCEDQDEQAQLGQWGAELPYTPVRPRQTKFRKPSLSKHFKFMMADLSEEGMELAADPNMTLPAHRPAPKLKFRECKPYWPEDEPHWPEDEPHWH